jgi:hypothetical protein
MASAIWVVKFAICAVIAGVVYYLAQTAIDKHQVSLPIQAYFDCIGKLGAFDWSKVPGGKPGSSSEICKEIASYR